MAKVGILSELMKVLFVSLQILMVMSSWYLETGIQALTTLNHLHEHHHQAHEHGAHSEVDSAHQKASQVVSVSHSHSHTNSNEEAAKTQSDDDTHEHRIPVGPSNATLYISFVDYHLLPAVEENLAPEIDEDFLITSHYIQGVFRPPIA